VRVQGGARQGEAGRTLGLPTSRRVTVFCKPGVGEQLLCCDPRTGVHCEHTLYQSNGCLRDSPHEWWEKFTFPSRSPA